MRMFDPAHPGEIIRDCMEAEDWSVTACALRLGVGPEAEAGHGLPGVRGSRRPRPRAPVYGKAVTPAAPPRTVRLLAQV